MLLQGSKPHRSGAGKDGQHRAKTPLSAVRCQRIDACHVEVSITQEGPIQGVALENHACIEIVSRVFVKRLDSSFRKLGNAS